MSFNFGHKLLGKLLFNWQGLKRILADYFSLNSLKIFWLINGLISFGLWVFTWLMIRKLPQDLAILHYNIAFGVDSLGAPPELYRLPLLALSLFLLNAFISVWFYRKDKFLLNLLLASAIFIQIIIGLALYSIYLINYVKLF